MFSFDSDKGLCFYYQACPFLWGQRWCRSQREAVPAGQTVWQSLERNEMSPSCKRPLSVCVENLGYFPYAAKLEYTFINTQGSNNTLTIGSALGWTSVAISNVYRGVLVCCWSTQHPHNPQQQHILCEGFIMSKQNRASQKMEQTISGRKLSSSVLCHQPRISRLVGPAVMEWGRNGIWISNDRDVIDVL